MSLVAREARHHWQPLANLDGAALPTPVRRILETLGDGSARTPPG
jgi:hypothetical protein